MIEMSGNILQNAYNMGTWGGDQGGQGTGMEDMLKLLGNSNPWTGAAYAGASALFGGLSSLLGGESDAEKRAKQTYNLAKNRLGQDVLDPTQYLADYKRSMVTDINATANSMAKRLNLDSGVAQGGIQEMIQPTLAKFMLEAQMQNDVMKSQNDNMLMQLMASLGRG
jgi:hypothetical protein